MSTVYSYKHDTKEYTGTSLAQENPVSGGIIVPSYATTEPPPEAGENQVAVFDEETKTWGLVDDYRGTKYYLDGQEHVISEIGETLPPGATTEKPLSIIRSEKKSEALAVFFSKKHASVTIAGKALPPPDFTTQLLIDNYDLLTIKDVDGKIPYLLSDGTTDRVSKSELELLVSTAATRDNALLDHYDQLLDDIDTSADPESIDVEAGWPT